MYHFIQEEEIRQRLPSITLIYDACQPISYISPQYRFVHLWFQNWAVWLKMSFNQWIFWIFESKGHVGTSIGSSNTNIYSSFNFLIHDLKWINGENITMLILTFQIINLNCSMKIMNFNCLKIIAAKNICWTWNAYYYDVIIFIKSKMIRNIMINISYVFKQTILRHTFLP